MEKVRFGIIGIGNIGTVHARYLLAGTVSDACLAAVCDNAPEKHPAIRQLVGSLPLFSDAQEMLQSGLIDAVIVATPHYEHPRLSMLAMRHGIHTLCEKPAGVYTAQVQEMNACARTCDVVFGIMYNQRPNPLYQKVKDLIDSGELGEIRRSNWIITNWYRSQSYYNSGGWRATWKGEGGGVLLNQDPHQLDLWQWLVGMPVRLRAFCQFGKHRDIEVEDDVTAYAEYANGSTGKTDEQPDGASGLDNAEDIGLHGHCHVRREVGKKAQYHMNLGRCEEEHTVHQENHKRNESQNEIVGGLRRQGCHIVVVKPLDKPLDKKQRITVRAFRFHGPPPFLYLILLYPIQ